MFHGSASGVPSGSPETANAFILSDQEDSEFGISVAGAGDVNGDGYADVIVGADLFDVWQPDGFRPDAGAAFVFRGTSRGVNVSAPVHADAQLLSNQSTARFGSSVAGADDVNGDGYADVIVGAPSYDIARLSDSGAAFVFLGSATGVADSSPLNASAKLPSDQEHAEFGNSVAGAGDLNGDGLAELIVGSPNAGEGGEGAAFVYDGKALPEPGWCSLASGIGLLALLRSRWRRRRC